MKYCIWGVSDHQTGAKNPSSITRNNTLSSGMIKNFQIMWYVECTWRRKTLPTLAKFVTQHAKRRQRMSLSCLAGLETCHVEPIKEVHKVYTRCKVSSKIYWFLGEWGYTVVLRTFIWHFGKVNVGRWIEAFPNISSYKNILEVKRNYTGQSLNIW